MNKPVIVALIALAMIGCSSTHRTALEDASIEQVKAYSDDELCRYLGKTIGRGDVNGKHQVLKEIKNRCLDENMSLTIRECKSLSHQAQRSIQS
ncbi:hypothetical protein [Vibrio sp. 10N.261.55.A7]|uniref:hypothetical protein n=1 Tax=Vibrio TaxID=662 RepID=UPI000C83FDF4|nr:hypothetical protein [Vibrio sp. 10N.261.55.A7]PMK00720.1 hypothetical protein BCU12_19935 [Vibrio sp. 10N.261.55.A7]